MGTIVARRLHFAQPGVCPNLRGGSCVIFVFRGSGRSSAGKKGGSSQLNIGRGSSGKTSLKTSEEAHPEPLFDSKSSNVVS